MRTLVLCCLLALTLVFTGCGGGSKPIAVTLTPSTATLMATQTLAITATVAHDGKNAGVTWALTGSGALSAQTTTSVTYTAPATISANTTATVTATSVSDATKVATLTINLQAVIVSLTPNSAQTVDQGQTVSVTATVAADPSNKGVTWSLTGNGALSGQTATAVTYTAPASIAAASTATITATSVFDTTKNQTLTINLVPPPAVTTTSLAAGQVGTAYSASLSASNGVPPFTWSVISGALPAGLSISGSAIAGTPTASGTFSVTVQAKDADGLTASKAFSLVINQIAAITSANTTTFTINTAGTFKVTATGYPTPALSETGALPAGVTFVDNGNATATLSGTATASGSFPITITANNGIGTPATQSFTLVVGQAPAITSGSSTTFTVGTAGTFSVTTTGYPAPSLTETGTLPSGVTFVDNKNGTATLSGTPAASTGGVFSITITAHNGAGTDATQTFKLTVDQSAAITSANSTSFAVNSAGSFTVTATGYPAPALSETGALPAGVTFVDNGSGNGTLSGTPTVTGTFPITLTANNGVGTAATQSFTLTVQQAPTITSAAATTFTVGTAGTFSVTTTGFPVPSLTETGALPSGVTFVDNKNGTATLAGTPAANTGGSYTISIKASNGVGTASTQSFTLTVDQAPAITSANNTTFSVGAVGTFSVTTSGYPNPSLSESGSLPSGVTFTDKGNGTATLAGTPASGTAGTYPITISANNGVGTAATQTFTLTVNTAPAITSAASTTFIVGTAGSFTVTTTGTPAPSITETGALPSGVTFTDNGNGTATLAGTPASGTGGTYALSLKASNGIGTAGTQTFTLTVNQAPAITSANGTAFTIGVNGSFGVTTTGFPTPALSESGALPSGVAFTDNGNGTATLGGTPAPGSANTYSLTITANNGVTPNGSQTFTLTVNPPAAIVISPSTGSLPNGTQNVSYGPVDITVTGGVSPYTFSLDASSAALPAGLSLTTSGNMGVISGTPTATGTTSGIIVDVTDSNVPPTVQKVTYSLTIGAVAACTTMGSESMLNGQYAFVLTGFDNESPAQPALVGGVLTFNGSGKISAGALDMNLNSGVQANLTVTSGSYGVGSDQRGCMVVTTSAGTQNYRFSLGNFSGSPSVASTGHVVDFDTTGPFVVGTMLKQTSSAFGTGSGQVTGNYVFGVSSPQNSAEGGGKFSAVGVLELSAGNVAGGEIDFNIAGVLDGNSQNTTWPTNPVSITSSGTYTVSSSTGRGTFTFTPEGGNAVHGIMYVVTSTETLALSSDSQTTSGNNIWAGNMMQQSGTPFTANPLSGLYVGYDSGLGNSGTGRTDIVLFGPFSSGDSSLTFTQLRNDGGTFTSQTVSSGASYSVSPSTGRTTVTAPSSNHVSVLYLVSTSAAFSLNSNAGADSGYAQSQTSTAGPSATYAFGNVDPQASGSTLNSGVVAFASPNITITGDENQSGTLTPDNIQNLTYSTDSTGLGYIPSGCTISASSTTCQTLFYIISPTKAVVMDTTSGTPKLTIADK